MPLRPSGFSTECLLATPATYTAAKFLTCCHYGARQIEQVMMKHHQNNLPYYTISSQSGCTTIIVCNANQRSVRKSSTPTE
ncbi:hypothetical protein Y1Q_0020006 [Alligator mississippiensis]|uniref:Uncharacterized protein n=1 Tax=Alligator mississippiensis TaxID=8496 RepID=A0A151LYM6_ALLMI|nr:hypothetical protein Y1Q_0020006 [Alligator mississippiensis]